MSKWNCKSCNKSLSDFEAWNSTYCTSCNLHGRAVSNTCGQCGDDLDLLSMFTAYNVCGKCCRANHKRATGSK